MKKCSQCHTEYPIARSYFNKLITSPDGYQYICRSCTSANWYKYRTRPEQRARLNEKRRAWKQTPRGRYDSYRSGAKRNHHQFELSFDDFLTFWQKPCYYCNSSIDTIGIDRIDSNIGYKLDNCVPCCFICNTMKNDFSASSFLAQISKIFNHCIK